MNNGMNRDSMTSRVFSELGSLELVREYAYLINRNLGEDPEVLN